MKSRAQRCEKVMSGRTSKIFVERIAVDLNEIYEGNIELDHQASLWLKSSETLNLMATKICVYFLEEVVFVEGSKSLLILVFLAQIGSYQVRAQRFSIEKRKLEESEIMIFLINTYYIHSMNILSYLNQDPSSINCLPTFVTYLRPNLLMMLERGFGQYEQFYIAPIIKTEISVLWPLQSFSSTSQLKCGTIEPWQVGI
ncbi:hypothetical protein PHYBLDRAFT_163616 [Phycomyces blakesleeanus NRRL 1555(-)]|uniref:Uncharacterized protein n=1 Tax=Phycomyces blakesleeanus (strain ATCC 8743b / DSM 1359 / FGSC 10004 / NBRC 33097 / NRRL 1555) TaxID=763407 RepID=A0A167PTC9_PHYB8|nr:hypothetical protein PHYBLDRAFT_163616 [Phycomyces blakesleeanus NRRL 1555(-)]OAD78506.1 hypothetical protein PHYBLDRAFT_163616 [Phycomyces blakesleeanus NRRL 1555(-)]|eukprot:XP_018296546.1 hypothetical protein PHYBLDRAFT_163616 [Phycomyces blakesleeanus NRRL 1555(-)]